MVNFLLRPDGNRKLSAVLIYFALKTINSFILHVSSVEI